MMPGNLKPVYLKAVQMASKQQPEPSADIGDVHHHAAKDTALSAKEQQRAFRNRRPAN
jgi:hypothetical protein